MHIINAHYVTSQDKELPRDKKVMEEFLMHLSETCQLEPLDSCVDIIVSKNIPQDKTIVAFTFDDGYEECHSIIAPLLEKYNCRGAFFINANYIESEESYRSGFNEKTKTYTKAPMSWEQVIDLHNRGHIIGSHTLDHVNMVAVSEQELEYQLKENKAIIESKLGAPCEYFAWPFGQMQHFSDDVLQITKKYHKYIFSGTNYKSYYSFDGQVFNRRHMEPFWSKTHINYFLSTAKPKP